MFTGSGSNKRRRVDGSATRSSGARKAIAINAKINSKYPYASFGRAYYQRGTPENISRFGETFRAASQHQKLMRKKLGYIGRGKYSFGKQMRKFGRTGMGKALQNAAITGIEAGTDMALQYAGQGLYSGRGLYSSNSLVDGGRPSMQYSATNDESQSVCISHSEYLEDVYGAGSAQFTNTGYALNPGLVSNFPWLSQIAANYEEYEFIQLLFHFKSTVDASAVTSNANGSTGTIIMATNYNPSGSDFTTKEVMMQYHGASSGRLVDDHTHGVECDPNKNAGSAQKYVRTNPVVVNQDPKTFDLGRFQLATVNIPTGFFNQQIGELWVTYTVKLMKPRLAVALSTQALESRWVSKGTIALPTAVGGPGFCFGPSGPLAMQQNMIPASVVSNGVTQNTWGVLITFPDFFTGLVEVQVLLEGTSMTFGATALVNGGNVARWLDVYGSASAPAGLGPTSFIESAALNGTQLVYIERLFVNPIVAGFDNTCSLRVPLTAGSINQAQLIIRQCNPSFAQASSNAAPLYVNASSVVTDPAL